MVMNAAAGIQSVNRHHINIIRVMGADRGAILRKIVLPTMMPFLVLGLRLSIPEAMTGAIIGEFISEAPSVSATSCSAWWSSVFLGSRQTAGPSARQATGLSYRIAEKSKRENHVTFAGPCARDRAA